MGAHGQRSKRRWEDGRKYSGPIALKSISVTVCIVKKFFWGEFGWCPPTAASCSHWQCWHKRSARMSTVLSSWRTGGWSQVDP
jgi:hypothetical protein